MRESYPFRQHCLCLIPLALLLCFIWARIGSEEAVFLFFSDCRLKQPGLTLWMTLFTHLANPLFYLAYAALFVRALQLRGRDPERSAKQLIFVLAFTLAQILVAALLCRIVKIAVGRPRPMTGGPITPFSTGWGYQSFPSGHTTEAVGAAQPLAGRYGKILLPLALGVYTAAVGFSRLYLGMHHPTDILGGMALGSLSGYLSWSFARMAQDRWGNCRFPWMAFRKK